MFPVGFLLQFDLKGIKISVCFYYYYFNTIVFNSLIFWGRLFVTYGIDLVSILNVFWDRTEAKIRELSHP